MADRFIPDRDSDFDTMAHAFATTISRDPVRYGLSADDAQLITRAAEEFRQQLWATTNKGTRSHTTGMAKDEARARAERIIRKYGKLIRANESISVADKLGVGIKERPGKLGHRTCPNTPPVLMFKGSVGESFGSGGRHILHFRDRLGAGTRAKPAGAARIELFVELVAQDEPIPKHPGELSGGRPWYLRSFTKNPIEVEFPMPAEPMTVVYWARWAGAGGEVGPFSRTVMARVEGWPGRARALPDATAVRRRQQKIVITSARLELPDYERGEEEVVAGVGRLLPEARLVNPAR